MRREILELALYTFKYVGSIEHVIAFMPPKVGSPPTVAIYLQKGDLSEELKTRWPERSARRCPPHDDRRARAADDRLAPEPPRYTFSLAQSQQGDAILVLAPAA